MKKYLLVLLCCCSLYAQAQHYDFTYFNEPYTKLTSLGTVHLVVGGGASPWSGFGYDAKMGFNFNFFYGEDDTLLFDNYMLGYNNDTAFINLDILKAGANNSFTDRNYNTNNRSVSDVWYMTTGEPGQRIFRVEYHNVKFKTGIADDSLNFQLWLYEGSNIIEYRFGPGKIVTPDSILYGNYTPRKLRCYIYAAKFKIDTATGDNQGTQLYYITGDPAHSQLMYKELSNKSYYIDSLPPNGMVYRFKPRPVGIQERKADPSLHLFPNPAGDWFSIEGIKTGTPTKITICSMQGEVVLEQEIMSAAQINIGKLKSGMYIVKIQGVGFFTTKKLVKQ